MSSPFDEPIFTAPSNYSINDYRKDIADPNPSLKARLVDSGVNAICLIHKNTPAAWLADQLTNDGKVAPEHILLDDLCRPRNQVPPDPVPPFSGGQCDAVSYDVTLRIKHWIGGDSTTGAVSRTDTYSTQVYGAVGGAGLVNPGQWTNGNVSGAGFGNVRMSCRGTTNGAVQPAGSYDVLGTSDNSFISIEGISVVRSNGQPDTCGDPPAKYPPALPSPGDLVTNPVIAITPTLSIPVRVEVKPTFKFDPTVIAPIVYFNVGGVDVHLDLGGFTLSPTFNNNTNITSPQTNPATGKDKANPQKNTSGNCADKTDISGILVRLNQIEKEITDCCDRDNPFEPPDANRVIVTVLGNGRGSLYDLPHRTFQVTVALNAIPDNAKLQIGQASPNVYFAGWAWFGAANNMSERQPLDSQFKIFSPPAYISNTFGFTVYEGYSATITAYSTSKPVPPS